MKARHVARELTLLLFSQLETYEGKISKKDFEDINIQINLDPLDNGFDIDIEVNLDTDMKLPDDFSDMIIDNSLSAVDEYVEERNKRLEEI